jgi:hypothetical protein
LPRTTKEPYRPASAGLVLEFDWAPEPLVVARAFEEMAFGFDQLEVPLAQAIPTAIADMRSHFKQEQDPGGAKWPALDPEYEKEKMQHYPGTSILVRTEEMKKKATSPSAFKITPGDRSATMYFDDSEVPDYWLYHQLGTGDPSHWGVLGEARARYRAGAYERAEYQDAVAGVIGQIGKGRALPQRAFVGLSDEAQFVMLDDFEDWIENTVRRPLDYAFGPAKYGEEMFPVIGRTRRGQPIVKTPYGARFGRRT